MKKRQLEALKKRRDAILAQLARDSDPATWPAMNDRQGRGDRLYTQRNLEASARLVEQLNRLIVEHEESDRTERHTQIEKEAAKLNKQAEERMVKAYGANWRKDYGGHLTRAAMNEATPEDADPLNAPQIAP